MALGPGARQATRLSAARIVGISLVRNEDLFVETAVRNAAAFCDEFYVADHGSTDRTTTIVRALADRSPKIHLHSIRHPSESQNLIRPFAGSRTWIFGVDGDEIYEPDRLARLREKILSGVFDRHWMLFGNVLHVTRLDEDRRTASGHLAPPCRSMTKLYNFHAIESWDGYTPERLHGARCDSAPVIPVGSSHASRGSPLAEADFRCLHLCFLKRSSRDHENTARRNIIETFGPTRLHTLWYAFSRMVAFRKSAEWKRSRYMRGPEVNVPAKPSFPARHELVPAKATAHRDRRLQYDSSPWTLRRRKPVAQPAFRQPQTLRLCGAISSRSEGRLRGGNTCGSQWRTRVFNEDVLRAKDKNPRLVCIQRINDNDARKGTDRHGRPAGPGEPRRGSHRFRLRVVARLPRVALVRPGQTPFGHPEWRRPVGLSPDRRRRLETRHAAAACHAPLVRSHEQGFRALRPIDEAIASGDFPKQSYGSSVAGLQESEWKRARTFPPGWVTPGPTLAPVPHLRHWFEA